jgi:hypothetical protein
MDLLLLGAGMGIVGGLMPSPLHLISLTQVALNRWARAIFVLIVPPLAVDGVLLIVTLFFYRYVPRTIAHRVAYAGGLIVVVLAIYTLLEMRSSTRNELAESRTLTYASVSVAALAELAAPGTWIYWLTIAGPIIAEGRQKGYLHIVPFFAGGLVGYYGAAVLSVGLIAWGASLHKTFKRHLMLAANLLLFVMGISYLVRAYLGR